MYRRPEYIPGIEAHRSPTPSSIADHIVVGAFVHVGSEVRPKPGKVKSRITDATTTLGGVSAENN